MLGFALEESMAGSYYRLAEPLVSHPLRLDFDVGTSGVRRFLRDRKLDIQGRIFAVNLAERSAGGVPLKGFLAMKLFDEKRIPYDISFEGDDGRSYRLRGQRDFFLWDVTRVVTTFSATLYDEKDREYGRVALNAAWRTALPALAKSLRPRLQMPFSKAKH